MSIISEYFELNKQKLELDKRLKELNKELKDTMLANNQDTIIDDGYKVELRNQDRSKMNDEKLVNFLVSKGLQSALTTKIVPNEEEVERLTYEGVIAPVELEQCIDKNIIKVLTVKKV